MRIIRKIWKVIIGAIFWIGIAVGLIIAGNYFKTVNPEMSDWLISIGVVKIVAIIFLCLVKGLIWIFGNIVFGSEAELKPKGLQWKLVSNTALILIIVGTFTMTYGMLHKVDLDILGNQVSKETSISGVLFNKDLSIIGIKPNSLFDLPQSIKDSWVLDNTKDSYNELLFLANISMLGAISFIVSIPFVIYGFIIKSSHIKKLARKYVSIQKQQ